MIPLYFLLLLPPFLTIVVSQNSLVLKNRRRTTDNYCLDNWGLNNVTLGCADCTGLPNQQFTYDNNNRLISEYSRGCIETTGVQGSNVYLAPCSSSFNNQKWDYDGQERFVSRLNSSLCLDLAGSTTTNGVLAIVSLCSSSINSQKWYRVVCDIGYQLNSGATACQPCPVGFYKSQVGNTPCIACPSDPTVYASPDRDRCIVSDVAYGVEVLLTGYVVISKVTLDPTEKLLYVMVSASNIIRVMNMTSRAVSTFVGGNPDRVSDGQGTSVGLFWPTDLIFMSDTLMYLTEYRNNRIRSVSTSGFVTTLVGRNGSGYEDGYFETAKISNPGKWFKDSITGNLLFLDGNRIRMINASNYVSTFAGKGLTASIDGSLLSASFYTPSGITQDSSGIIYVADASSHTIRKINMTTQYVSTIAGKVKGWKDGMGSEAQFSSPSEVVFFKTCNCLIVLEREGKKLRRVSLDGNVTTIPIDYLQEPAALIVDSKDIMYMADSGRLLKITPCPVNAVWNGTSLKCECLPSFQSSDTNKTCLPCPAGTEGNSRGSGCSDCSPGKHRPFLSSPMCINCPLGQFKNDSGRGNCNICPVGTESSANLTSCISCPPGKYRPSLGFDTCINCPLGTFKNDSSRNNCTACPIGTESSTDLTACIECPRGTYRSQMTYLACIPCPVNALCLPTKFQCLPGYSYNNNTSECVECSTGFAKEEMGNEQCFQCPIGTEPNQNKTSCIECQGGKFKPSNNELVCIDCSEGASCTPYNRTCLAGYTPHTNISHSCQLCSDGYFKDFDGNAECISCAPSTFSSDDYKTCLACPAGSYLDSVDGKCKRCGIGRQPNNIRTSCMDCPPNTYKSDDIIQNLCWKCPSSSTCTTVSFSCLPGYELGHDGRNCRKCMFGYIKPNPGNTDTCVKCGIGQQSNVATTNCASCPTGYHKSKDVPYLYCIPCPPDASECSATEFKCKLGYDYTSDKLGCYPKRIKMVGNVTVVDLSEYETTTMVSDNDTNNRPRISFEWSRFYLYGIFYAIIIPVLVVVNMILLFTWKFMKWRRHEKQMFDDITNKTHRSHSNNDYSSQMLFTAGITTGQSDETTDNSSRPY